MNLSQSAPLESSSSTFQKKTSGIRGIGFQWEQKSLTLNSGLASSFLHPPYSWRKGCCCLYAISPMPIPKSECCISDTIFVIVSHYVHVVQTAEACRLLDITSHGWLGKYVTTWRHMTKLKCKLIIKLNADNLSHRIIPLMNHIHIQYIYIVEIQSHLLTSISNDGVNNHVLSWQTITFPAMSDFSRSRSDWTAAKLSCNRDNCAFCCCSIWRQFLTDHQHYKQQFNRIINFNSNIRVMSAWKIVHYRFHNSQDESMSEWVKQ